MQDSAAAPAADAALTPAAAAAAAAGPPPDPAAAPHPQQQQQQQQQPGFKPLPTATNPPPPSSSSNSSTTTATTSSSSSSSKQLQELQQLAVSYKAPAELTTAPSKGKVSIAGRRLATGEVVEEDVIKLADYSGSCSSSVQEEGLAAAGCGAGAEDAAAAAFGGVSGAPPRHAGETQWLGLFCDLWFWARVHARRDRAMRAHVLVQVAAAAVGGLGLAPPRHAGEAHWLLMTV
jgi:hypothetical protein